MHRSITAPSLRTVDVSNLWRWGLMAATVIGLNLSKAYNVGGERVHALNDVSLEVYPGEMVGVVGRAGAGKSTLMHVLGGLQRPDSGQVLIDDQDVTQLDDAELARVRADKVGLLFQAFNILPNETVLGNVDISLQESGLPAKESRRKAADARGVVGLGQPFGAHSKPAFT